MDALMLEVKTRGLSRYFKIDQAVTTIGRALDNDIILSDSTVAAHHLRISLGEDGQVTLENLAEVNQLEINNSQQNRCESAQLPVELQMGRISARLLSPDHAIAPTRPMANQRWGLQWFKHGSWAIVLPIICLLVGGLEYYLSSYSQLKWDALTGYIARETALNLALFIVLLSVIERLLVNRWEVKLLAIYVSLGYLLYKILSVLVDEILFLLSSQWPSILFSIGWYLLIIPAAISLYLIKISHFKTRQSIVLAILICSPFSIPELLDSPLTQFFANDFSSSANYHKTLSAVNWHLTETVSIEAFIQQAKNLESGEFVD